MLPKFLNTGWKYQELYNVTDVQAIMDAVVAMLRTPTDPTSNWTQWYQAGELPLIEVGEYCAPGTIAPSFMIKMTRLTQYTLDCRFKGCGTSGVTIANRRMTIPSANGVTARIFAGDGHFAIDCICWSAVGEGVWGGSLDVSPDLQSMTMFAVNTTHCGGSRRSSDGVRDNYDGWQYAGMQAGDETPTLNERAGNYRVTGGGNAGKRNLGGSLVYRTRDLWNLVRGDISLGTQHWIGRCWQTLLIPDVISPPTKVWVPVDTGVLAQFTSFSASRVAYGYYMAMRCG